MVILGLGSNLGDRAKNISKAIQLLKESVLAMVTVSPVYESEALLVPNSPKDWDRPFFNLAVMGETHMTPSQLLKNIKTIEKKLGRSNSSTWAPREIDIDILAFDSLVVDTKELQIPHHHLCNRPFALLPLADLAPNWRYPVTGEFSGKTAYELAKRFKNDAITQIDADLEIKQAELV